VQRNVYARQQQLEILSRDLSLSEIDLKRLDDLLALQKQLGEQDGIFKRIGKPIEMTKLMSIMQQIMPQDMALLDLSLETEEAAKPPPGTFAARMAAQNPKPPDPKLRFRLHGVAPTDVDLGEFLAKLTTKPFFKQVELMYSRERVEAGHVMRDFEVSFMLDLSVPQPPAAAAAAPSHGGH
jgi:hypothetical protein